MLYQNKNNNTKTYTEIFKLKKLFNNLKMCVYYVIEMNMNIHEKTALKLDYILHFNSLYLCFNFGLLNSTNTVLYNSIITIDF